MKSKATLQAKYAKVATALFRQDQSGRISLEPKL